MVLNKRLLKAMRSRNISTAPFKPKLKTMVDMSKQVVETTMQKLFEDISNYFRTRTPRCLLRNSPSLQIRSTASTDL